MPCGNQHNVDIATLNPKRKRSADAIDVEKPKGECPPVHVMLCGVWVSIGIVIGLLGVIILRQEHAPTNEFLEELLPDS